MGPPVSFFPAGELPERIQTTVRDRRRKDNVELEKCKLMEMLQYECVVENEGRTADSRILCQPIQRLFRRYVFHCSLAFVDRWTDDVGWIIKRSLESIG
jgi:hypothetical protein